MFVIHLFSLGDLIAELDPDMAVLRVEGSHRVTNLNDLGLTREFVRLDVRAIYGSAVFVYQTTIGRLDRLNGRPFGENQDTPQQLAFKLYLAKRALVEHLQEKGYTVRAGLIDIGDAVPVGGDLPVFLLETLDLASDPAVAETLHDIDLDAALAAVAMIGSDPDMAAILETIRDQVATNTATMAGTSTTPDTVTLTVKGGSDG